jgi:hypothetical protein
MNIITFFEKQVEKWNDDNKCGYCWHFEAPLRLSDLNESVQKTEECCVRVFLTDYSFSITPQYSPIFGRSAGLPTKRHSFTIYYLLNDRIDINVYSEQKGHLLNESKWKQIIEPLLDCDMSLDICELFENILEWSISRAEIVIDFQDQNYTGLKIIYNLNEKI